MNLFILFIIVITILFIGMYISYRVGYEFGTVDGYFKGVADTNEE